MQNKVNWTEQEKQDAIKCLEEGGSLTLIYIGSLFDVVN